MTTKPVFEMSLDELVEDTQLPPEEIYRRGCTCWLTGRDRSEKAFRHVWAYWVAGRGQMPLSVQLAMTSATTLAAATEILEHRGVEIRGL